MSRLDLQKLTLLLALVAGLLTFANSFFAGYSSQRDQLFDQTLEANRAMPANWPTRPISSS